MTFRLSGSAVVVLTVVSASCKDASYSPPTQQSAVPVQSPPSGAGTAFRLANGTLSGIVTEVTPTGRGPLEGVVVANGEGGSAVTDRNGFYSIKELWVCPCAAQPWVNEGTTFLWVEKEGYADPIGQPPSVFNRNRPDTSSDGWRDVVIDGNTRFNIELVRK